MGKQKGFKLKRHDPFVIYGDTEHSIPPLEELAYDDWKDVAELATGETNTKQVLDAYKEFFLRICPELDGEQIGDNQWLQLGSAYFEAMGES